MDFTFIFPLPFPGMNAVQTAIARAKNDPGHQRVTRNPSTATKKCVVKHTLPLNTAHGRRGCLAWTRVNSRQPQERNSDRNKPLNRVVMVRSLRLRSRRGRLSFARKLSYEGPFIREVQLIHVLSIG